MLPPALAVNGSSSSKSNRIGLSLSFGAICAEVLEFWFSIWQSFLIYLNIVV
jgi:hypothetical protein